MTNPTKRLLLTTAALFAGVAVAAAQGMSGGGAQNQGSSGGMSAPGGGPSGGMNAPGGAGSQSTPSKPMQDRMGPATQNSRDGDKGTTTGQGATPNAQRDGDRTGPGQREPNERSGQNDRMRKQSGQQGQSGQQSESRQSGGSSSSSSVSLTTEQRTKIRQTVLTGGNAPRVANVNFNIRVGTVVPTTVRYVEVPTVLIDVHPDWRGHYYFVVNDEIIIVDRSRKIVAVLAL